MFKLSPMIGKSFLGESLNFPIGKLKLSYRRIFPITGESLAEGVYIVNGKKFVKK